MGLEGADRLIDECDAVGEEENALGPVAAHEQVGQGDDRARLASAGGHDEQGLAVVVRLEGLAYPADRPCLVEAFRRSLRSTAVSAKRFRLARRWMHQLEFGLCQEALHGARRVVLVVPEPVLVSVAVEDDGTTAELLLQTIGVELRLLLADLADIFVRLASTSAEWLAVVAPKHVVDEALAVLVRHSADFELAITRFVEGPASFLKKQVDEEVASLRLGIVVRVGCAARAFFAAVTSARKRVSSSSRLALSASGP